MPYAAIRGTVSNAASGSDVAVTLPATTKAGDALVALVATDYGTAANITGATTGAWTQRAVAYDTATQGHHAKVLESRATADGAQTLTFPGTAQVDRSVIVVVLDGSTVPSGSVVDVAASAGPGTSALAHAAPAVTTTATERLLLRAAACRTGTTYTVPSGYTKLAERASGTYVTGVVASAQQSAQGSTGSVAFTAGASAVWSAFTVAIVGVTPPVVVVSDLVDTFDQERAQWVSKAGSGVGDGTAYLVAQVLGNGQPNYANRRSDRVYTWSGSSLTFEVTQLPSGGEAFAQMWVRSVTSAGALVGRLGFEYRTATGNLDLVGQTDTYAAIGTTQSVPYDPVAMRHLRIEHTGTAIRWLTSPTRVDGSWTVRRTLTTGIPSWAGQADLQVSFEAYRSSGAESGQFRIDNVNTPAPTSIPAQTVSPSAVGTGYRSGSTTVRRGAVRVSPSAVPTGYRAGSTTVRRGVVVLRPSAVATRASLPGPRLSTGSVTVRLAAGPSLASLGRPTVLVWPVVTRPGSIATGYRAGALVLRRGAVVVRPAGASSSWRAGALVVRRGAVAVLVAAVATGYRAGAAVVRRGAVTVRPSGVQTRASLPGPTVRRGAVSVAPSGVPGRASVPSPVVTAGAPVLRPSSITSGWRAGALVVRRGLVAVAVASIPTRERTGRPAVVVGVAYVRPASVPSRESAGRPALGLHVTVRSGASVARVGSPAVVRGLVVLRPASIPSRAAVGVPWTGSGTVPVLPGSIPSDEVVPGPTLEPGQVELYPAGLGTSAAVGVPTLVRRPVGLAVSGVASTVKLGRPTVRRGRVVVRPAAVESRERVQVVSVAPGRVHVRPSAIRTGHRAGRPALWVGPVVVLALAVATREHAPAPTVRTGRVRVGPSSIPSTERVGLHLVALGAVVLVQPGRLQVRDEPDRLTAGDGRPAGLTVTDRPTRLEVIDR